MTAKTAGVSLASLDLRKASDVPFEFEYVGPDGRPTGLWFKVLGAQSEKVSDATNALINQRRKQEAVRAAKASHSGRNADPEVATVEDDIDFARRLNAVRLVGWRGPGATDGLTREQLERFQPITDPWSEDAALMLVRINPDIADQVAEHSGRLANFTPSSSKTS